MPRPRLLLMTPGGIPSRTPCNANPRPRLAHRREQLTTHTREPHPSGSWAGARIQPLGNRYTPGGVLRLARRAKDRGGEGARARARLWRGPSRARAGAPTGPPRGTWARVVFFWCAVWARGLLFSCFFCPYAARVVPPANRGFDAAVIHQQSRHAAHSPPPHDRALKHSLAPSLLTPHAKPPPMRGGAWRPCQHSETSFCRRL